MEIMQLNQITDNDYNDICALLPQLNSTIPVPGRAFLDEVISSGTTTLFVAREEKENSRIIGMASLVKYKIPSGFRLWIEDVVVDSQFRGSGLGMALTKKALDSAHESGYSSVYLTSRPARKAANHLYQKMGFKQKKTNVYYFEL